MTSPSLFFGYAMLHQSYDEFQLIKEAKILYRSLNEYVQSSSSSIITKRSIISHTLDFVKDCDNIIYIENGQILEDGDHNTLIDRKGKYYELINNSI